MKKYPLLQLIISHRALNLHSIDRNSKGLSFNEEKFLTLVCYSPDQISQYIESYATEQKKIGSRMFQTIVQEQVLIDTSGEDLPTADTYVIRDYYCSEGGYYYNFSKSKIRFLLQ